MVTRVFHTTEEIHRMARAALDRGYTSADTDIVKKLRELQPIVLPENRQKHIHGRNQITGTEKKPNISEVMDTLSANGYKSRHVVTETQEADVCVEASLPINGHSTEIPTDDVSYPEPEEPSHLGATMDLFMKNCAKQLVEQFMGHLRLELAAAVQKEFMPAIMPSLKAAKLVKPKILIIGLKPQQAAIMIHEFGNQFDLRFVDSGRGASASDGKTNVDRIIGMTNFMSHSAEDHIKHHPGYKRVSGGMDSLRDELKRVDC
jgi:hypothetical protein